jgi:hypothetical protein
LVARYGKGDSGRWIEDMGLIQRLIADDDDGARHQRLVLELPQRHTVLVAHNVDVAERVPAGIGDRLRFRGLYEWNDRGGLVHWTHADPMGEQAGGWICYRGKNYR